jgi:hypothetical protein
VKQFLPIFALFINPLIESKSVILDGILSIIKIGKIKINKLRYRLRSRIIDYRFLFRVKCNLYIYWDWGE